jgi:hypothetical protein
MITNADIVYGPLQSVVFATGLTAFLALVGKSRPGTFLKATAYLSAAQISFSALDVYGEREVNRAVFKRENIEPKPGKLWEQTKHWTVEDASVSGGALGTFLALNPRALPGVGGWKRFLGAATVGCAVGGYVGATLLVRLPPQLETMMRASEAQTRMTQYQSLKQDPKAMEPLSRFGRLALRYYTWPVWDVALSPFSSRSSSQPGRVAGQAQQLPFGGDAHANITQEEMDNHTLIQIEFNKGELKGPDIEHGYRAYKDSITERDTGALLDWLEYLQEVRQTTASEAQYLWQHLARKEHEFYQLVGDDREKDITRREIQLLNNMASDFASRDAILAYHIADAQKRLQQTGKSGFSSTQLLSTVQSAERPQPEAWADYYSPQLVAEQVRINWTRQKELLGFLEHSTSMHGEFQPEAGTPQEAHLKQIQQNADGMKKNIEATERLLKEFEEQIRKADEHVKS